MTIGASLTFHALRTANMLRLPQFKNGKGEPAHSKPDGSDWKLSAWCNALLGELGEAANLIKKIERGDFSLAEYRGELSKELADVQTYLDILAFRAGIDLGDATAELLRQMGVGTVPMTFATMRAGTLIVVESLQEDGRKLADFPLSSLSNGILAALGRAADLISAVELNQRPVVVVRKQLAAELAKVQTRLDLLAFASGVGLGEATIAKFNEVSKRVGSDVTLSAFAAGVGRA
jgi:NTP pyrophosphatase (non-canonical NTP hydrolase)